MYVVIKPTYHCNLACSYCYVSGRHSCNESLSKDQLEHVINSVISYVDSQEISPETVTFLWHGGEPLLMPISFYEHAMAIQQYLVSNSSRRIAIKNKMQTNLFSLNDEWVNFFKSNKWQLSTSLDGPPKIHDSQRMTKEGNRTHRRILGNIESLKTNGVNVGVVCVLTRLGVPYIDEIYAFFKERGINFRLNDIAPYASCNSNLLTEKEYTDSMIKLFDLWFNDEDNSITIQNLLEFSASLISRTTLCCNALKNCQDSFLGIDPAGNVFPCGRFCGNNDFVFGNLFSESLSSILSCEMRQKLLRRNALIIKECANCQYSDICNGGCLHDAVLKYGSYEAPSRLCSSYKSIFRHMEVALKTKFNLPKI